MLRIRGVPVIWLVLFAALSAGAAALPHNYLLLGLLLVPLVGVAVGAVLPPRMRGKTWGLAVSASTLFTAISIAFQYDWARGGYQFVVNGPGVESIGFHFTLGVDAISLMLVLLTAVLHPLAVTASLRTIHARSREHYAWMNFLLVTMLGCFIATDLLLFYAFFEASLIPLLFIVGIWGGKERRHAANRLFIYTFSASVFALAAIVYLGVRAETFDIAGVVRFAQSHMSNTERFWILLALLAAFAVKTPLWPLHSWLPLAHTEAPTAGSVDLAALVLKLGTYGLLRIALPIGIIGADWHAVIYSGHFLWFIPYTFTIYGLIQFIGILCLIGIIYAALVAWAQTDVKKLIAYSSVSHLGFCVLGMLALNPWGMGGSVLYMINHGITSGALFLVVGMIYNRYHTRDIRELSGLGRAMPKMSFFLVLFTMAAVGLPGLNGFVSEFLTTMGAFTSPHLGWGYAALAATGVIWGACYMLKFATGLLFGPLHYPVMHEESGTHQTIHPKFVPGGDITGREVLVLTPLAILVVVLGVWPAPLLRALDKPLQEIARGTVVVVRQPAVAVAGVTPGEKPVAAAIGTR